MGIKFLDLINIEHKYRTKGYDTIADEYVDNCELISESKSELFI